MKIPENTEVQRAYWYVLKEISKKLGFNIEGNRVISYSVNLNVKQMRGGMDLVQERQVLNIFVHEGILKRLQEPDTFEANERFSEKYTAFEVFDFEVADKFDTFYSRFDSIINYRHSAETNLLKFNPDGEVTYISSSGKLHSAKLRIKTNPFILLAFLAKNPNHNFQYQDFHSVLKKPRAGGDNSLDERRVLDTVHVIRKKMDLLLNEMIVVDYGVELKAQVQIVN